MLMLVVCLQAAHLAILLVRPSATASNVVQRLAPLVTAAICLHRSLRALVDHRQEPWLLLTCAFCLWAMAQSFYLAGVPGRERVSYRRLTRFAGYYALFSTFGYVAQLRGGHTGTLVDLCWSAPFAFFSLIPLGPIKTEQELPALACRSASPHALGVGLSLDDFGTGYSSLSYMLNLPFDMVNIDQSFVHSFDSDSRRGQIVRSIIDLAGKLEMKIVAEGVETQAEMTRFREHGCDMVQGYFVAKPLEPRVVDDLLEIDAGRSLEQTAERIPLGALAARLTAVTEMGAMPCAEERVLPAGMRANQASLTAVQIGGGRW